MNKTNEAKRGTRSGRSYPLQSTENFWGMAVGLLGKRRIDMATGKPLAPKSLRDRWGLLQNCPVEQLIASGIIDPAQDLNKLREAFDAHTKPAV